MKAKTLISILESMDADAEVYVRRQQHLPWECALSKVAVRKDFDDDTEDNQRAHTQAGTAPDDVFLAEGSRSAEETRLHGARHGAGNTPAEPPHPGRAAKRAARLPSPPGRKPVHP